MAFKLRSPAFGPRGAIPLKYTGIGTDISTPLHWTDPTEGTKSFALTVAAGAFTRLEELGVDKYRVMERESWRFSGSTAAAAILEHLPDWGDIYARRKHAGS